MADAALAACVLHDMGYLHGWSIPGGIDAWVAGGGRPPNRACRHSNNDDLLHGCVGRCGPSSDRLRVHMTLAHRRGDCNSAYIRIYKTIRSPV